MSKRATHDPRKDYYALLGVPPSATLEEIQRAYRRRAKEIHPDANPSQREWATHAFKQLREAYAVLTDPAQRTRYDAARWPFQGVEAAPRARRAAGAGPPPAYPDLTWPRKAPRRRRLDIEAGPWIPILFLSSALLCVAGLFAIGNRPSAAPDAPTLVVLDQSGCQAPGWHISGLALDVDIETGEPFAVRVSGSADASVFTVALEHPDLSEPRQSALTLGPAHETLLAQLELNGAGLTGEATYVVSLKAIYGEHVDCRVSFALK